MEGAGEGIGFRIDRFGLKKRTDCVEIVDLCGKSRVETQRTVDQQ